MRKPTSTAEWGEADVNLSEDSGKTSRSPARRPAGCPGSHQKPAVDTCECYFTLNLPPSGRLHADFAPYNQKLFKHVLAKIQKQLLKNTPFLASIRYPIWYKAYHANNLKIVIKTTKVLPCMALDASPNFFEPQSLM